MGELPNAPITDPTSKPRGCKSTTTEWTYRVRSSSGLITTVVMTLFRFLRSKLTTLQQFDFVVWFIAFRQGSPLIINWRRWLASMPYHRPIPASSAVQCSSDSTGADIRQCEQLQTINNNNDNERKRSTFWKSPRPALSFIFITEEILIWKIAPITVIFFNEYDNLRKLFF